ncbi:hypothetical protein SADUNF_Sadunf19G0102300 [Salix dunnii]|uniref:CAAX prenyl protease 2/Lysostaphin resistance protein A-like domain-containing protein n=1 Tax=Salix dunnii TaxID=1413687 RepID=A0A835MLG3_9ROSI|nr:hypothetical protein SADUNF_Sadunf19G0102300 [Salix dunnii]
MQMRTVAPYPTVGTLPARFGVSFNKPLIQNPNPLKHTSKLKFKSNIGFKSSLKCHCIKKEITDKPTEGFSVLSSDIPWERGNIWSTMALYMFNLHIPLGIGGLSIVANVLHQPVLDPQTEDWIYDFCFGWNLHPKETNNPQLRQIKKPNAAASTELYRILNGVLFKDWNLPWGTSSSACLAKPVVWSSSDVPSSNIHDKNFIQQRVLSLLAIQILELTASLLLLKSTAKPEYEVVSLLKTYKLSKKRNWLLASSLGFGFLILLVFLTSLVADRLIGPKAVNNPIVKEILLSGNISKVACILVYCLVTPLLEEIVYRGFLLKSLASTMNWQQAVFLSSAVFSAAHFSGENFIQLFIIGCVLGCSYSCCLLSLSSSLDMGDFENRVKERAKELKFYLKKGVKIVGDSCKKGWYKVKNMKKR